MRTRLIALILLIALTVPLASQAITLDPPIKCPDIKCVMLGVLRVFLGLLAVFATFVFIYGGFLMLTSAGNPEMIKKARETLFWATIGIVVVLGSWIFIRTVIDTLQNAS